MFVGQGAYEVEKPSILLKEIISQYPPEERTVSKKVDALAAAYVEFTVAGKKTKTQRLHKQREVVTDKGSEIILNRIWLGLICSSEPVISA